jgi:hypothetical protein
MENVSSSSTPKFRSCPAMVGALAKAEIKYARDQDLQVIAKCEFVASHIEKHSEFANLLGSDSESPGGCRTYREAVTGLSPGACRIYREAVGKLSPGFSLGCVLTTRPV